MIDFTNCKIDIFKTYDGTNGSKRSVFYNDKRYMVKFPPKAKPQSERSYTNGCVSEHIASSIYKTL